MPEAYYGSFSIPTGPSPYLYTVVLDNLNEGLGLRVGHLVKDRLNYLKHRLLLAFKDLLQQPLPGFTLPSILLVHKPKGSRIEIIEFQGPNTIILLVVGP